MPRLGLISDPELPEHVAQWLADRVPRKVPDQLGERQEWSVEIEVDPVAAGRSSGEEILRAADEQRRNHGWDYAVCLTDLPLRFDQRPVLADVGINKGVGLISLPALGAFQPYRRAGQMLVQILDELTEDTEQSRERYGRIQRRRGLHSRLTEVIAPIRREYLNRDEIGVRYRATHKRGRVRLLSGMVRSNSPWRLITGMSRALAAAVATSAFGLSSSTVWQISYQLGPIRQVGAMVGSIALLVGWIIAAHRLWEKPRQAVDREQRALYNISTVFTLVIGIGFFYSGLFAINFLIAALLVPVSLLVSILGSSVTIATYLSLAWGFTTMGVIAGALGANLETEQTVRQAAYGYREAQRRRTEQHRQQTEPQQ
ncbi:hypothetical protein [Actinopolyspora saharensis]|uniref:5,10-methylene-tetrahydrofolate dehydrogenase n=1 Tax=Actinopolyspora saharensis TaxID=995062 RepID=A0A1H0YM56_9ACTN|nr:hypothetical protein [Actinopolyspora saharensis]SDQ16213.1 hypothetical protein SAMN04489718_0549 [Actinopolyspora saharensis]